MSRKKREIDNRRTSSEPLAFPKFAERYLGAQNISGLNKAASMLNEYESLAKDEAVPIHELAEYLGLAGILDEARDLVIEVGKRLNDNIDVLAKNISNRESYSVDEAKIRVLKAYSGCFSNNASIGQRPILHQMINDMIGVTLMRDSVNLLNEYKSTATLASPAVAMYVDTRNSIINRNPEYDVGDILTNCNIEAIGVLAEELKNPNNEEQDVSDLDYDSDKKRRLFIQLIRENKLAEDHVTFNIPENGYIESRCSMTKTETNQPFCWGLIRLDIKVKTVSNDIIPCLVQINHTSDRLIVSPTTFTSMREVLECYGITDYNQIDLLEYNIIKAIFDGIANGEIDVEQDAQIKDLEDALGQDDIAEVDNEEEFDYLIEEEVDNEEQFQEEQVKNEEVEVPEKNKAKAIIRNVSWRRALRALKRLGVEVSAGRHVKLSYTRDRVERCSSFPNVHTGKTHDVAYLLKPVLKILHISPDEFIKSLRGKK